MEQPWPPPGPWSLPRAEGETEEESDLDVSPGSPRCPPLPGGGAQVSGAHVLLGDGEMLAPSPLKCRVSTTRFCAHFCTHYNPRGLMPFLRYCSIFWSEEAVAIYSFPTTTSTHTFSLTLDDFFSSLEYIPHSLFPDSAQIWGGTPGVTLTLCPLVRAFLSEYFILLKAPVYLCTADRNS